MIELIIVIVILAILGAIVVYRFANVRTSANIAVLDGIEAAVKSMAKGVHTQSIIQDVDTGSVLIEGRNISIFAGYPTAHWNNAFRYLLDADTAGTYTPRNNECISFEICGVGNQKSAPGLAPFSGNIVMIWLEGFRLVDLCYFYYIQPEDGSEPVIDKITTGC